MTDPIRCPWPTPGDALYESYHDTEWGVPEYDDRALFEKLILDGFQAGLSWRTILYKRENFREAFDGFSPEKIARWDERKIDALLQNKGIIRSRLKIEGARKNARSWLEVMEKESFSEWLWSYWGGAPLQPNFERMEDVPAKTPISEKMAKDLKKRGFTFCGPVIVYAFAQAVGMTNDHLTSCFRHAELS
ncbi:DNA-3-methyladenine glycosylase I [Parvularcula sp. ZS-1/3]|uniref:DNA-3-methyladenine glycosylase I n=1 Tax=Parvularcula mediterranea TaxID=2732508 RepID=A0A7Y3W4K5_9PROT|nr:DNA-3-methyladenine glycosylase I [Parvularcula mediterranea]NNU15336.1 DNA-3-methyladenine glycosylase I [Parvularcula mediterranea]